MPALLLMALAGFAGFAMLLTTAPQWVIHGGGDASGAGLVTGILLGATVVTQFLVPRLLTRFGLRTVLVAGLLFLGVPSPLFAFSFDLVPVLALSTARGIGFGILTVTCSTVVASLAPAGRRGAAIGIYGLAVTAPMIVLLPGSLALAEFAGYGWMFVAGAVPVLGIGAAISLAAHPAAATRKPSAHDAPLDRDTVLTVAQPTLVLFVVTAAAGSLTTFLPQLVSSGAAATAGLFVLSLGSALCRWGAGSLADRHGARRFLVPLLLINAVAMAGCAWAASERSALTDVLMVAAIAVVGVVYGAVQNLTMVVAFARVRPEHVPTASAGWNIGYDLGTACGAVAAGAIAAWLSFPVALAMLAGLSLAAVAVSPRRR